MATNPNCSRLEKFFLFGLLFLLLGIASARVHSFDLFWQLQSGKYIFATKAFIYRDIFSLAADAPRYEHCWLHDLLFYATHALAGYDGISMLKGGLIAATALLLAGAARVRGSSCLSLLFLLPPALFLTRGGWLERPQLWTFLFFALFVLILERFRQSGGRQVWLLLPLMVLWANLHAGSILAFPVLAAYLAGEGGDLLRRRSSLPPGAFRQLCGVALLLPVAALVTPYGVTTLQALVAAPSLGVSSGVIAQLYNTDWRPTTFAGFPLYFYAMAVTATLLAVAWKRLTLADLFLLGGLALMGLKLERHTTIFLLAMAALLPRYADAAVEPLLLRSPPGWLPPLRIAALAAALALTAWLAWPAYRVCGFFDTGLRTWHYPVAAADFVREHRLPPNLYNTYDWGGYLMWTLYPDYKVFWDGRSDSLEMFERGLKVTRGEPGWQGIFELHQVNTVITKACTVDTGQHYPIIDRLRESPDWALVFSDVSALVFVRRTAVPVAWLQERELPAARIDDTILSEATLLTSVEPTRYKGWWEIARVHLARKDYRSAFPALEKHLKYAPEGAHEPEAENYYRLLFPMMQREG